MKKIIFLLLFIISTFTLKAQVSVVGYIQPLTGSSYPTHLDTFGYGGFRVVADTNERNSISSQRRRQGMLVFSVADTTTYQLRSGILNSNWIVFRSASLTPVDSSMYVTVTRLADTMRGDSIQTVLNKGNNSTKALRFGSSANISSTKIDSSGIYLKNSSAYIVTLGASGLTTPGLNMFYSYTSNGIYRYNVVSNFGTTLEFTPTTGSNKTVAVQDKSGTLSLLSDITDTLRGDSLQKIISRGKNTSLPIRFGTSSDISSLNIDSTGVKHYDNGILDFEIVSGTVRLYSGGGSFKNILLTNTPTVDVYTAFQNKSGTVALLSDITDTITNRVATKKDTVWTSGSLRLVTQSQLNAHAATNVLLGGNTVGSRFIIGSIDSQDIVNRYFNRGDTIRVLDGLHTYEAKNSEVIARFFNYNQVSGLRNTKGILLFSSLTSEGQNYPGICFGSTYSTSNPRITETGLFGYSLLNLYGSTTAGTIIKPAYSGANTGDALTLSLGSYTISNNTPTASGIMNMFKVGTGSANTGKWAPTQGSTTLNMIVGAVNVNASGTYTGNIKFITDDSVVLAGLGSGGTYYGLTLSKNSGWGVFQSGSSSKNSLMGNTLIGSTTDNGEKFQITGNLSLTTAGNRIKIAGGSNSTLAYATLSGGSVVVSNTSVTSNSHIFLQPLTSSISGADLTVTSITLGTGFTITSSDAGDNRSVSYLIIDN